MCFSGFLKYNAFQFQTLLKDSKTLAAKEKEVKKITDGLSALQEASNRDAEALATAQQHFNAVSAGLSSSEDGAEATLAGQMMACKNDISKTQTEAKQVSIDSKNYVIAVFIYYYFYFFVKLLHTMLWQLLNKMLKIFR